jgi:hypothetical protein
MNFNKLGRSDPEKELLFPVQKNRGDIVQKVLDGR